MRNRRRGANGFSIAEILLSLVILALIAGTGLLTLNKSNREAGSRGLAEALAAELRAARMEAMSNQILVAAVFPNSNQTNPVTSSVYLRQGVDLSWTSRIKNYGGEYRARIFVGSWDGPFSFSEIPIGTSSYSATLNLSNWLGTSKQDYSLVFLPNGFVRTQGFPTVLGVYPILVANAVEYAPATGGFFQASRVSEPYTVAVSPVGDINVIKGALGAGPSLFDGASGNGLVAPPPAGAGRGSNPPQPGITLLPSKNPNLANSSLAESFAKINPEKTSDGKTEYSMVTLLIQSTDPDGGPLYFSCQAVDANNNPIGNFTTAAEGRMEWDFQNQTWLAVANWRPPVTAVPGSTVSFQVTVRDTGGLATVATSGAQFSALDLTGAGRIVAQSNDAAYVMNFDGTDMVSLTPTGTRDLLPEFTEDGTKIVMMSDGWVVVINADGTLRKKLKPLMPFASQPLLSPRGSLLVYDYPPGGDPSDPTREACVLNLGSGQQATLTKDGQGSAMWITDLSGSGQKLLFFDGTAPKYYDVTAYPPTITPSTATVPGTPPSYGASCPSYQAVAFAAPAGGALSLWNRQNTGAVETLDGTQAYASPSWSRDGKFLCCTDATGSGVYWNDIFAGKKGAFQPTMTPVVTDTNTEKMTPKISDDGKWIFFLGRPAGSTVPDYQVYRVDPAGANPPLQVTSFPNGVQHYSITQ